MYIYGLLVLFVLLQAGANFILKYNGLQAVSIRTQYINFYVFSALVCYGLSFILYVHALAKGKLSVAVSFSVLNYVVIVLGSYFLFHEKFNFVSVAGIGLITAGLILVVVGQHWL